MFIEILGIISIFFMFWLQFRIGYEAGREFELKKEERRLKQESEYLKEIYLTRKK